MTTIDVLPTGLAAAVLGAIGGVVTYFLNQFIVERYRAAVRTKRLRDGLLVDCVEILHRVNRLPFAFQRTPGNSDEDDLRQVRNHPNGFVICGPLSETRELVTLLDQRGSRLVVRFFERWATFANLESRYSSIYQKLLETAAQCRNGDERQAGLRELREEYWDQLRTSLAAMRETGNDLCFFACQLFKQLGTFHETKLREYSGRRWSSWDEFETELRRYAPHDQAGNCTPTAETSSPDAPIDVRIDAAPPKAAPQEICVVRRRAERERSGSRA